MKHILTILALLVSLPVWGAITVSPGGGEGGGGATNGIQMLNGIGTNTTLRDAIFSTTATGNISGNAATATTATTATNTSTGALIANAKTNGITYVGTNGVDAVGNGRLDAPLRSFTYALTNLGSARTIRLGPGYFAESLLNLTNLTVQGAGRGLTFLVYSNASYGWRTWTNVVIEDLSLKDSYTNSTLTYPLDIRTGSLIVRRCDLPGQSDVFFPRAIDPTEALYIEADNCNFTPAWDAFNLVNCHRSSRVVIKNPVVNFRGLFGGFPRRFVAGINGHYVTVIGATVVNQLSQIEDSIFSGTDLANLRVVGGVYSNVGPMVVTQDHHGGPEMVGVIYNGSALPDRFSSSELRPSYVRHISPWWNSVNVYATNKTEAYLGETLGVSSSGTTAANGKYVFAGDTGVFDDTWSFSQRTWTNTTNRRLIIVRADTNEVTYINLYQLFTNSAASVSAASTAWTLIAHAETWDGGWTRDSGPAGAPVVTNYTPELTLYVDAPTTVVSNLTIAGPQSTNSALWGRGAPASLIPVADTLKTNINRRAIYNIGIAVDFLNAGGSTVQAIFYVNTPGSSVTNIMPKTWFDASEGGAVEDQVQLILDPNERWWFSVPTGSSGFTVFSDNSTVIRYE